MLSLLPPLERRLGFVAIPCVAFAFWTLLVLAQINLQGPVIRPLVLGMMLVCCLLALGFVSVRRWPAVGMPGALILAAMAVYLVIATAVLLFSDARFPVKDVARQAFFLLVTLAAILGGRALLERMGVAALLQWALVVLTASCIVIVASLPLRGLGLLPEYWLARATGAFTDPNDAGFIACMTVALALALLYHVRQRRLAYPAFVLGYGAAFMSFSHTAMIVMSVILVLFPLLHVRRWRQNLWPGGLSVLGIAGVLLYFAINLQVLAPFPSPDGSSQPETVQVESILPGMAKLAFPAGEAGIRDTNKERMVGDVISVYLVNDELHRADDDPVQRWHWQRADARAGDANTPDDATWSAIDGARSYKYIGGARSYEYITTAADAGKFLRAHVSYEKDGLTYRVQTGAVGPIGVLTRRGQAIRMVETIRGESITLSEGGLARRIDLWQLGGAMFLESPLVGHGLYRLHYIEGTPLNNQRLPAGVHNVYLMLAGESGVVPLALYLLCLFFLLRTLWTTPMSPGRDTVVGWTVVMALFSMSFQHLLTMGAYNFLIGLSCALAAFLVQGQRVQGQREPTD